LAAGKEQSMHKFISVTLAAACLAGASFAAAPALARETVGVQVGDVGIAVGNGHYYDRHHHRHAYTYASDYKSYNHPQAWYRSHSQWNDRNHADWYRN
jgi:hypothetical protein